MGVYVIFPLNIIDFNVSIAPIRLVLPDAFGPYRTAEQRAYLVLFSIFSCRIL